MGFTTDNGNVILDVHGLSLVDPAAMEARIRGIAGVVTVGLFAQRGADVILVGTEAGVTEIKPKRA
jgi:ribose 5-phosphate isomerase A